MIEIGDLVKLYNTSIICQVTQVSKTGKVFRIVLSNKHRKEIGRGIPALSSVANQHIMNKFDSGYNYVSVSVNYKLITKLSPLEQLIFTDDFNYNSNA